MTTIRDTPISSRPPVNANQLIAGIVILIVGLGFLLARLGLLAIDTPWRYWPLILIAMGLSSFLQSLNREPGLKRDPGAGLWSMSAGVILLLHTLRIVRLNRSWPLFIVAIGVGLIVESLWTRPRAPGLPEPSTSQLPGDQS
jgi:hypothetical protein